MRGICAVLGIFIGSVIASLASKISFNEALILSAGAAAIYFIAEILDALIDIRDSLKR